ncbi:MAG TPA: SAM-dependent methyltransferase [Candidatus Binataceae bacterium]|nr:SAM-dependent methyltransferase [Candidatus Binataceae bacterium]
MYPVSPTTDLLRLARRLAGELRHGAVVVDGEFQRLKRLYIELANRLAADERARLANLMVPLSATHPELRARLNRRIGAANSALDLVPFEHLLLTGDFPPASRMLDKLFPHRASLSSGVTVTFNDARGLISIGQHRAVLAVLDKLAPASPAARLSYTVERHHDHVTFHRPVQVQSGVGHAIIDVAQLEKRDDFARALERELLSAVDGDQAVWLDADFVGYDRSCVWNFNRAFWRFLSVWETVTGKSYQRALPKGRAESNHQEFIDEAAARFAGHVRELEREGALAPDEELWIGEKAPGSGGFIAGLLNHLRDRYPQYYSRLRVVLSDISADVLGIAARELKKNGHLPSPAAGGARIFFCHLGGGRAPELEGGEPLETPPEGRFLYVRHANFFDQLPTRLFARTGARYYEVQVRAAIDRTRLAELEARFQLTLADLLAVIEERIDLATIEPDRQARFIHFWSATWEALKLDEQYQPVDRFADLHPDGGEIERLFAKLDDIRFVTSDVAVAIMRQDLRLLDRRRGYACFTDIYLQRAAEFAERWIELAKYDNGVWVGINGVLMSHLLEREGYDANYHPVELTLGAPTAVYTMTATRRHPVEFVVTPELVQELTGIAGAEVAEHAMSGLPARVRNNLRDLPALLTRVEADLDWSRRTLDESLDLTRLMRELYYHSPPAVGERSLFVKMAALVGDVLDRNRERRLRIEVELSEQDLPALEDFLDHRPITELPAELLQLGRPDDDLVEVSIRLPTIAHKLKHGEFLMMAEVDMPRAQTLEQLRRRILQFQGHVDAVSLTSGRMADPRFLRSREMLAMPLFGMVYPERLVLTLDMCDRQAADLERDIRLAEGHGVHNLFIVTGDFERDSQWALDSVNGIHIADRMRHGEGPDGRPLEHRSRLLIAGAMTWGGIPDIESRVERDSGLKLRAGADLLFTQPVYDLRLAHRMLDLISERNPDRAVRVVAEILPLLSLDVIRNLSQTPGIMIPPEMLAAYEQIDRNVVALTTATAGAQDEAERFAERVFQNVGEVPGYEGFFSLERARALVKPMSRAVSEARSKALAGQEIEAARRAARRAVLAELGFGFAERAMAALIERDQLAGFLFVARTGRDLRRLVRAAERLRAARAVPAHRYQISNGADAGRRYGSELVEIADRLAPYGLSLPDGTPTDQLAPALISSATDGAPSVLTRIELNSDREAPATLPPAAEMLTEALASAGGVRDLGLEVLCVPTGWDRNSAVIRSSFERADCELKIALRDKNATAANGRPSRLAVRLRREPWKMRLAAFIERHPMLYGLVNLGEFWIKHPLFGQILCGGPCGVSGAWQFSCTMAKTFTTKRQIERNLLERPIFVEARAAAAAGSALHRELWKFWEAAMRAMLWPPILLRRAIVAVAGSLPSAWFLDARNRWQLLATRIFNHLECPKSLRNGACGAPSTQGLCGELMKYGISKPCVFCYRNSRDRFGQRRAAELMARAERWRRERTGWIGALGASTLQAWAAFVDRRPLSLRTYPAVDSTVPGASAIVSAMRERFDGATIFGNPALLPTALNHAAITVQARTPVGRRMLPEVRRYLGGLKPRLDNRSQVLTMILRALGEAAARMRPPDQANIREETTYERMFMSQIDASTRRGAHKPH